MKNLKRSLALVLALIMCIGVLAVGANAASTLTDEADIHYLEAVQTLYGLGVVDGYEDGSFRPAQPITRGEYAKLICTVMNGGKAPVLGTPKEFTFTDTKDHWAAPYIEYLAGLGIVAGYGDGTYGPDDTITGQEAVKILLVVMGYDAAYEKLVGSTWAARADALANLNHLYDGLDDSFVTTDLLNREEAVQIIYNALWQYVRVYWSAGDHGTVGVVAEKTSDTLFEFFFSNADFVEGFVIRNGFGCIYCEPEVDHTPLEDGALPTSAAHDSYTDIVSFNFNEEFDYGTVEGDDWDSYKAFTPADAIGKSVRLVRYLSVRAGVQRQTVRLLGMTEYNKTYTTTDVGKVTAKAAGMELAGAKILRNFGSAGASIPTTGLYYNFNGWKSTFIDNDDAGECEFVQQYITTPYLVKSIGTTGANKGVVTLTDLTSSEDINTITYDDDSDPLTYKLMQSYFFNEDGTAATVKKGDVILAAIYGGRVWLAEYDTFVGEIDKITHSIYEDKLTIDEETYLLHDTDASYISSGKFYHDGSNVADLEAVRVGAELKFYVDEYGYIFYAEVLESTYTTPEYAVIIAADDYNLLHAKGQIARLVFADGTCSDVNISELCLEDDEFDVVSHKNKFHEFDDEVYLIAYTVLEDGTYKVAVIDDSPMLYDEDVEDSWKGLTNGVPKILRQDDTYSTDFFTDSKTNFIDVDGLEAFVGYNEVPTSRFWKEDTDGVVVMDGMTYYVSEYLEKQAYALFNDLTLAKVLGNASGAKITTMQNHVTNLFALLVTYPDYVAAGKNYFYIPNTTADYYDEYRIDGELVREYEAVVDGVPGKTVILPKNNDIVAKQLYYKKTIDANEIVRTVDEVVNASITTATATAIQDGYATKVVYGIINYASNTTLVIENAVETTYAITDNTVFVDAATSAALDGATEGKMVFAVVNATTSTVLQVYQQA